jgi:hypothetical protein
MWMSASLRLAVDAWRVVLVAAGDGEHCSKFHSDNVSDGTSCGAKERQGHAVYPTLKQ